MKESSPRSSLSKLSLISLSLSLILPINSFSADIIIPGGCNSPCSSVSSNDTVRFTASGQLNLNTDITIGSISTNVNGAGTISLNTAHLTVSGKSGSSNAKLDSFSLTSGADLTFNDDVYANNISGSAGSNLTFTKIADDSDIFVDATISNMNQLTISNGFLATFNKDISASNTLISNDNSGIIINSNISSVSLGNVNFSGNNQSFTANSNVTATLFNGMSNDSTLTIANNKKITVTSGASTLDGTVNLGISYDGSVPTNGFSTSINNPSFDSNASTVTIASGTKFNFDYSNATDLNKGTHRVLEAVSLTSPTINANDISDTSILLIPSVSQVGQNLVLTNNYNTAVDSSLNSSELSILNAALSDQLTTNVRTELYKISDLTTLRNSLSSLRAEKNNMTKATSLDIANRIQNVINYRTMALNYNYVGFSSGNNQQQKGSLWGEVFGGFSEQEEYSGEEGYKTSIGGVVFGVDRIFKTKNRDYTWGLAASYSNADVEGLSFSNQNTDINSYQATLYNNIVRANGMGLFSENSLSFGYNQYESIRAIKVGSINQTALADYYGLQYSARAGLGYNFNVANKLLVSPNVSVKYSVLDLENYKETSPNNLGLDVDNENFETVSTDAGVRIMGQINTGKSDYSLYPQLNLSWTRNITRDGRDINSSFIGTNVQTRDKSIPIIKDVFNIGGQLNIETGDAASFILKYELQGAKNYLGHFGSVRYKIAF